MEDGLGKGKEKQNDDNYRFLAGLLALRLIRGKRKNVCIRKYLAGHCKCGSED